MRMPMAFERERAEGEGLAANDEVISADNRRPVKCERARQSHQVNTQILKTVIICKKYIKVFRFLRYNNYG